MTCPSIQSSPASIPYAPAYRDPAPHPTSAQPVLVYSHWELIETLIVCKCGAEVARRRGRGSAVVFTSWGSGGWSRGCVGGEAGRLSWQWVESGCVSRPLTHTHIVTPLISAGTAVYLLTWCNLIDPFTNNVQPASTCRAVAAGLTTAASTYKNRSRTSLFCTLAWRTEKITEKKKLIWFIANINVYKGCIVSLRL